METWTRQERANGVAQSFWDGWHDGVYDDGWEDRQFYSHRTNESPHDLYNTLVALGPTPDPDEVDRIMDNDTWTDLTCSICHESKREAVVEVYVDIYGNIERLHFCPACVKALSSNIRKAVKRAAK